jgi:lipopolysaccharide export system protein LptA
MPGIGQLMFAGGGVLIRCPSRGITLRGDSAERFPDHDQMIGHAVYDEPRFHVTSDYLNYFPLDERVVAAGTVHARLPSGSTLDGPQAEYRRPVTRIRPRAQMSAIARPTITIIEKDSTGKPAPPMTVVANNVFMDGDSLIYAGGQVVITRPEIVANSDSAFIDQGHETMKLMRNPVLRGKKEKPFTLNGDLIQLFSKDRKLTRVLASANAKAVTDSMTLTSDTLDLRVKADLLDHAYAWGTKARARVVAPGQNMLADSLDVFMPGQRIQLVRALRRAVAEGKPDTARFTIEKPDTTDWIHGDTIVAHFDSLAPRDTAKNPRIKQLTASGHASSLYHMAPSDTAERRPALNHVTARIITIDFNQQKVATVTTVDSVSGIYIEPKPDSTAKRRNGTNAPGPTPVKPAVQSVVPLPPKPPIRP